jgi:hypothetical protein
MAQEFGIVPDHTKGPQVTNVAMRVWINEDEQEEKSIRLENHTNSHSQIVWNGKALMDCLWS